MNKKWLIPVEIIVLIAAWVVIKYLVGKTEITTESIAGFAMYLVAGIACLLIYHRNAGKKDEEGPE